MSYFRNLIEISRTRLPLLIEQVDWDGTLFYMGGRNWNFNSSADWVIVNDDVMISGCHDNDIKTFMDQQLLGKEIIDLQHSLDHPAYDPIFFLSNKLKLKFFSTTVIEPWTLGFENKTIFVASPSDTKWNFK